MVYSKYNLNLKLDPDDENALNRLFGENILKDSESI